MIFCAVWSLGRTGDLYEVSDYCDLHCDDGVDAAIKYWKRWKENAKRYYISKIVQDCVIVDTLKRVCQKCLQDDAQVCNEMGRVIPRCMTKQIPPEIALHPDKDKDVDN